MSGTPRPHPFMPETPVSSLRLVFAGSPDAAVPSLRAISDSRHDVVAVVTREDSPRGRRRELSPTSVAVAAADLGVPILKTDRLTAEVTEQITALRPDLGVIVAFGALVREPLLSVPRLGWINLHFSLLPRWRGAAPVQRAIIAGDEITGAAVFQLVPGLDAGAVFGEITEPIGPMQTAGHLLDTLSLSGAQLLVRTIDQIADGTAEARPQAGDATLAPKLTLDDGRIDWTRAAELVHDLIRGVTPEPGAHTMIGGDRLKVLAATIARDAPRLAPGELVHENKRLHAGTATDAIELLIVQPAGKKAMAAADWWRGRPADAVAVAT